MCGSTINPVCVCPCGLIVLRWCVVYGMAGGVDGIIAKMRALVGQPPAQRCVLPEGEIIALCDAAKAAFMSEGSLAEYGVPAQLFGDIHGQFYDLLKLFENFGYPDGVKNFVFLGDYGTLASLRCFCTACGCCDAASGDSVEGRVIGNGLMCVFP